MQSILDSGRAVAALVPPPGRHAVIAGRILSGLVILFLLLDAAIKFMELPQVLEAYAELGFPLAVSQPIAWIVFLCAVLYANPSTAILGAVMLTGLLGGAIASHVRLQHPLLTHTLFGLYVGVLAWAGLWLRDPRVRALLPLRRGN